MALEDLLYGSKTIRDYLKLFSSQNWNRVSKATILIGIQYLKHVTGQDLRMLSIKQIEDLVGTFKFIYPFQLKIRRWDWLYLRFHTLTRRTSPGKRSIENTRESTERMDLMNQVNSTIQLWYTPPWLLHSLRLSLQL